MEHDECVRLVKLALDGLPVGSGPDHGVVSSTGAVYGSTATELVYGEMTFTGMKDLHDALGLRADDVLYDLGSGVGKFVLYTALRSSVTSATGIEVGIKRHATAERGCTKLSSILGQAPAASAASKARTRLGLFEETRGDMARAPQQLHSPSTCASFAAVLGDITERACIYRDATIVVLCNIMFGAGINGRVLSNLLTRCPRLRIVASIVQMPNPRLRLLRTVLVGCTWAPAGVAWHLYEVGGLELKERSAPHWLGTPMEPVAPWRRPRTVGSGFTRHMPTAGRDDTAPSLFAPKAPLSRLSAEARRQRILARGQQAGPSLAVTMQSRRMPAS